MSTLPATITTHAHNLLARKAATGCDGFRQWYYPHLPQHYAINPQVKVLVRRGMLRGLSAQEIADEIYQEVTRS